MKRFLIALPVTLFLLGPASPANGQTVWKDRGYVSVSGWLQSSESFASVARPVISLEPSVVDTSYKTGFFPGLEAAAGVRVWRNLAIGIEVSRFSKESDGAVSAQVPHPFFFNRPRLVSGNSTGLTRDETAVHAQALWMVRMRKRWRMSVTGGPSWISVGQDIVADVTVAETYPYDTAAFGRATAVHRSRSRLGFNAGADASYVLRRHVGVGVGISYAHASVPLDDTLTVDAGGVHVNAGLRFRF